MKTIKENKKGFTLIEIIVVVTILAVLMAVAVPAVMSYLDEGSIAKDMAIVRGAKLAATKEYADSGDIFNKEDVTYVFDNDHEKAIKVTTENQSQIMNIKGYGSSDIDDTDGSQTGAIGKPKDNYVSVTVTKDLKTSATWGEVVISQAAKDALNFDKNSNEYKILMALPQAQKQALAEYKSENRSKYYLYPILMKNDGTFELGEPKKDVQIFHEQSTNTIMNNSKGTSYVIVVGDDGKVGTNLYYDSTTNKVTGKPYHILNNQWNNYAQGINFDYN